MQSKSEYINYELAMAQLRERLGATPPEELAAWVFMGKDDGGLVAFTDAKELDTPPRFFFGKYAGERDYLPLLYRCWFKADDIVTFAPGERFITGEKLLERWAERYDIPAADRIETACAESRLNPVHPTLGLSQAAYPDVADYAPLEDGLFSLADIKAYERKEFGRELGAEMVQEAGDTAKAQAAYDEAGLNGKAIDWRYWVHQMPALNAMQAACLMSALEPDVFANLNGRPGKVDPAKCIEKARKVQRLAEAQGKLTASPAEWVEWAQSQLPSLKVHTGFLLAVEELPEATGESSDTAAKGEAGTGASTSSDDWKVQARAIADELALERYQRGEREITARNISDAVAIELAKDSTTHGIRGERSAGNIRNLALKGWKFIPQTGTIGTSGTNE